VPDLPGADGPPSARSGGWIRLAEARPTDELVLVAMADAWMPPLFSRMEVPLAVPTIDLTVHLRGRPDPDDGWCFIETASPVARDGYLVEHARLHDRRGRLLAESRQLALVA
jgi:acyl-CoA thioesterase